LEGLGRTLEYSLEDGLRETIECYRVRYVEDEVAVMKEK